MKSAQTFPLSVDLARMGDRDRISMAISSIIVCEITSGLVKFSGITDELTDSKQVS